MKRCLLLLGFFLFSSSILMSQVIDKMIECPIEDLEWGMSKRQVLEIKDDLKEKENYFWNEDEHVYGYPGKVAYYFGEKDKLQIIMLYYDDDTYGPQEIYEEYADVEDDFNEKIGAGTPQYEWLKEKSHYKGNEDRYGLAVAMNELKVTTIRQLKDGEVRHILTGRNDKNDHGTNHVIIYIHN